MRVIQQPFQPTDKFVEAFHEEADFHEQYYHYPMTTEAIEKRLEEIDSREFPRKELASVIRSYMQPIGLSSAVEKNLQALEREDSVCIIGGQQVGLLTGPLYSLNKAISVILYAKEMQATMNRPFVPVFWMAGEDHDLDEINHTFVEKDGKLKKKIYTEETPYKWMASQFTYTPDRMVEYIHSIMKTYPETSFTKQLTTELVMEANHSTTLTLFFARLMNKWFKHYGLLLIDAADPAFKQLQSEALSQMIEKNEVIRKSVVQGECAFEERFKRRPLFAEEENSHLFYVDETGRHLLSYKEGQFVHEPLQLAFSKEQLLSIAKQQPEKISNDVVTRPLMQELMFPTFAFMGGYGELAYWATYKELFEAFEVKIPLMIARQSITLMNQTTQNACRKLQLSPEDALVLDANQQLSNWIEENKNPAFEAGIHALEQQIVQQLEQLKNEVIDPSLLPILEKNKAFHLRQLAYLKKAQEKWITRGLGVETKRLNRVMNEIRPLGQLQERVLSPYPFLNEYGPGLVHDLLHQLDVKWDGRHLLILL